MKLDVDFSELILLAERMMPSYRSLSQKAAAFEQSGNWREAAVTWEAAYQAGVYEVQREWAKNRRSFCLRKSLI